MEKALAAQMGETVEQAVQYERQRHQVRAMSISFAIWAFQCQSNPIFYRSKSNHLQLLWLFCVLVLQIALERHVAAALHKERAAREKVGRSAIPIHICGLCHDAVGGRAAVNHNMDKAKKLHRPVERSTQDADSGCLHAQHLLPLHLFICLFFKEDLSRRQRHHAMVARIRQMMAHERDQTARREAAMQGGDIRGLLSRTLHAFLIGILFRSWARNFLQVVVQY